MSRNGRHRGRRSRWTRVRVVATRLLAIPAFALLTVLSALLVLASVLDADEPAHWGTFTEKDCVDPGIRRACRSIGTWVSDDGALRKVDVFLDGRVGAEGFVRARYTPTGIINDQENNIVHAEYLGSLGLISPWLLLVICAGTLTVYVVDWVREARRYRGDDGPDAGREARA